LFVAVSQNGTIVKISPHGTQSTFATGLNVPVGLAFDRAGKLFVSNIGDNSVTEITTTGQSTFVSGLSTPRGLAFDGAGNLFEADEGSGTRCFLFPPFSSRLPSGPAGHRTTWMGS
jgi:DNA-binding beta-propeller fold protein YncE